MADLEFRLSLYRAAKQGAFFLRKRLEVRGDESFFPGARRLAPSDKQPQLRLPDMGRLEQ